ncbi:MAG: type II toxin-antitoxin system VapC family toxin [Candidatus Methanofastidiosia archaeon]
MPDRVVLDSSVIAAVFFREDGSERAEKDMWKYGLITIDVALSEIANVAWKRVVFFGEPCEITLRALKRCADFVLNVCEVITSHELLETGFGIAVEDKIAVYDALFVAASEREKASLLTLDRKLYETLRGKRDIKLV